MRTTTILDFDGHSSIAGKSFRQSLNRAEEVVAAGTYNPSLAHVVTMDTTEPAKAFVQLRMPTVLASASVATAAKPPTEACRREVNTLVIMDDARLLRKMSAKEGFCGLRVGVG